MKALHTDNVGRFVVLYDGVCNLCTGAVRFIIQRDPKRKFAFAALQSETGKKLLETHGLPVGTLETLVLVDGTRHAYVCSEAALRIAQQLSGLWPVLGILRIIPRVLRDGCYKYVSRHRYQWFGKRQSCLLATPENLSRFLK